MMTHYIMQLKIGKIKTNKTFKKIEPLFFIVIMTFKNVIIQFSATVTLS
jgi:hypothetical protein